MNPLFAPPPAVHPDARRYGLQHPVTLLVWHDLVPEKKQVWFDTTVAEFEQQLAQLERLQVKPVSLSTLYLYLSTGKPLPAAGSVVLCFDDNTVGIYHYAAARLRKRNWPFAVSAHTAYIGVKTGKDHSTFGMLGEMERQGATIVSQTHTHPPDLTALSPAALAKEMSESKRQMEQGLGHGVSFLTYPSGKWNARVARAAEAAGYRMALTEDRGAAERSPHLLAVNRYSTHRRWREALAAIQKSRSR